MPLNEWRKLIPWRLNRRRLAASLNYRGQLAAQKLKGAVASSLSRGLRLTGEGEVRARLSSLLRTMNQTYRPAGEVSAEFNSILLRIAAGESVKANELIPYLCLEGRDERAEVNALLADAYYQAGTKAHVRQAKVFMERAWILSTTTVKLLPLYLKIFAALKETEAIRAAYKRVGMRAAREGNITEAIEHFNSWQRAFAVYENLDKYEYDLDILASMDALAAPHSFHHKRKTVALNKGEKIRLGYLVEGVLHLNSVLIKINLVFARLHNRELFDITFFIPEADDVIAASPQGKDYVRSFEATGFKVVTVPPQSSKERVLLEAARRIYDAGCHLLVTSAGLARFEHYFVTALRPAPVIISLVQGPPAQFAPPIADWSIAWSKHPLMDTASDCSLVELEMEWQGLSDVRPFSRAEFDLPASARVLLSAGRPTKFQDEDYWNAIISVMKARPESYYLLVGPKVEEIPFLNSLLTENVRRRVRCLGWREDFFKILPLADVVLDTYPNGGGQVLVQAMSLGLPFISYSNDYMKRFDQINWSPAEQFIDDADIIIPRGDFDRFKEVLTRLIADEAHRKELGERCLQAAREMNPEKGVRACEEIYLRVLKERGIVSE